MSEIIILILIGYLIGFFIIAYFGITGTLELIEFKNNQIKKQLNEKNK
jgi:hypothetical protein|tara:strand:- start:117 stop:260 length:144 start_codon:yes stop_codon:yes gene_type:complete